jgi:hypothetical protein
VSNARYYARGGGDTVRGYLRRAETGGYRGPHGRTSRRIKRGDLTQRALDAQFSD